MSFADKLKGSVQQVFNTTQRSVYNAMGRVKYLTPDLSQQDLKQIERQVSVTISTIDKISSFVISKDVKAAIVRCQKLTNKVSMPNMIGDIYRYVFSIDPVVNTESSKGKLIKSIGETLISKFSSKDELLKVISYPLDSDGDYNEVYVDYTIIGKIAESINEVLEKEEPIISDFSNMSAFKEALKSNPDRLYKIAKFLYNQIPSTLRTDSPMRDVITLIEEVL